MQLDRYIIAVGNAFDGLTLVGFFTDTDEAAYYAEKYHRHDTWEVISLQPREDLKMYECISCEKEAAFLYGEGECSNCYEPPEVTAEEIALRNIS